MDFVHLHCHSAYSLLRGTATPQALVAMAKQSHMPALALTDHNVLYGAVAFYTHAQKAGIKPVIGMDVELDDGSNLVLLARNFDGYRNLCHIATMLGLNADPETLDPAGFDDPEDPEILPWEPGVWGAPVFAFTHPADRRTGKFTNKPTPLISTPKSTRLAREAVLSGRHVRGLLALSGGRCGLINTLVAKGKIKQASQAAGMLVSSFGEGNVFIELTALDESDLHTLPRLVELANELGIPIVATNDVLYPEAEGARTALALAAVRRGRRGSGRPLRLESGKLVGDAELMDELGTERYFKTAEQMAELFSRYPQAIANTRYIAEQCNVELPLHKPLFPSINLAVDLAINLGTQARQGSAEPPYEDESALESESETPYSRLLKLCFAGAALRYKPLSEAVLARLAYELQVIERLGFSPYFLVVHDIVRFAHSRDIPVLARGSVADSLVAFVLGISQVDPLAYGLLFERFLNLSRAQHELPDIDLDLCWRRRDEVLHYVYERYGRDHVSIVGTSITFRLRSAWREMARALDIAPDRINRIAARLPHLLSAEDVLEGEEGIGSVPELDELANPVDRDGAGNVTSPGSPGSISTANAPTKDDIKAPKLRDEVERTAFELCQAIEGLPRHAGMHCAGVVISPDSLPLADLVPLQRAARDATLTITQYDKDAIEAVGLVKMDLLGSRALTALVDALRSSGLGHAHERGGSLIRSLESIPMSDARTYSMMAEGDTLGCFQLESPGMRGLLKWLRPRNLSDMAAAVSLFRPGPLEGGFLEMFMRRRLGQEPVVYPHPLMEPVLKDTYGVILYQEQFLTLAHELGGLNLGEAEELRKALGKARTPQERARLGDQFVAGAIERGISQLQAEQVWAVISGYTGFGFCRGHACTYALAAYRSAYVKAHYPAHFIAAVLNNGGGYYGPGVYIEDARRLNVELLPPHVNESRAWCEVSGGPGGKWSIRLGLQFIKGLSERTIAALLAERRSSGRFDSLSDLLSRVQMSPSEATGLVKVGACDRFRSDGTGRADSKGNGDSADTENAEVEVDNLAYIERIEGKIGEPAGAAGLLHRHYLNRRQLLWLLPQLISTRKPKRAGAAAAYLDHFSVHTATGSDGLSTGVQTAMGDFLGYTDGPRVLGRNILHLDVPSLADYTPIERVRLELDTLGFSLTCNEMDLYRDTLADQRVVSSRELQRHPGRKVNVAGVAVAGRRHMSKSGEWMLFLTLQDSSGLVEVVLFPDAYRKHGATIANGGYGPYVVQGAVQVSGEGRGIGVQLPTDLRANDTVAMKMHPVIIGEEVRLLHDSGTSTG